MIVFYRVIVLLLLIFSSNAKSSNISRNEMVFNPDISKNERAKLFELSIEEWAKYEEIMSGPQGFWTPNLSPVYILALYSQKDSIERKAYMTKLAKLEADRVMRELDFVNEFRRFSNAYHNNVPAINEEIFMGTKNIVMVNDKFVIVVNGKCQKCIAKAREGLLQLDSFKTNSRDYHFSGVVDENEIIQLATSLAINVKKVHAGIYTLNPSSNIEKYLDGKPFTIMILRNNELYPAEFVGIKPKYK